MIENLDTLRKTAEAATPGPWVLDGFAEGGCSEGCCEEYTRLSVYSGTNQGEVVASVVTAQRNADYFDTFNPETVLALLSRLEQAEQDAYGFRKGHEILSNALIKQGERLEQAEQAREQAVVDYEAAEIKVHRVRELHGLIAVFVNRDTTPTAYCAHCYDQQVDDAEYPCPTIRALDGDTRRLADDALGGGQDA